MNTTLVRPTLAALFRIVLGSSIAIGLASGPPAIAASGGGGGGGHGGGGGGHMGGGGFHLGRRIRLGPRRLTWVVEFRHHGWVSVSGGYYPGFFGFGSSVGLGYRLRLRLSRLWPWLLRLRFGFTTTLTTSTEPVMSIPALPTS